MNARNVLKKALALSALGLWFASLYMVPFSEGEHGGPSGFLVLFILCTFGVIYVIGIPWVALNFGLLYLGAANLLQSRGSNLWGWGYLGLLIVCLLWLVLDERLLLQSIVKHPNTSLNSGAIVWIAACLCVGLSTLIDGTKPETSRTT